MRIMPCLIAQKDKTARFGFAELFMEADTVADLITRTSPVSVAHLLQECQDWGGFHSANTRR